MAVAIGVTVRFLARLRELAGTETERLQVPAGSTVVDVYAALQVVHPTLPSRQSVRAAVNHEFADWDAAVADWDEIAFIPPVSGGCACAL